MKKRTMTAILSIAMVAVLAVGATLAFLSASSGTVNNTFTGAQALSVAVKETSTDGSDTNGWNIEGNVASKTVDELYNGQDGIEFVDVIPGAEINKNADVVVPELSVKTVYLYAKITVDTGLSADINANWTKVDGYTDLYAYNKGNAVAANAVYDVFDTITVGAAGIADGTSVNVTVTAAVVQGDNTAYSADIDAAAAALLG